MCNQLQRAQKVQQFLLLCTGKFAEVVDYVCGFASAALVIFDRRKQIGRPAIVQQEDSLPQTPQRGRAELVATRVALRDVIRQSSAHVMDLKIRVRIHRDVAECGHEA